VPLGPKRAAWRAVLFAQNALVRIFDDELQRECGTSLQVYDVLIRIWLAPEHTLRMSELAESALLSRSWITRRVDRLEQSGLVERLPAGDDDLAALTAVNARHATTVVGPPLPVRGR
jgi:DNA-binding MarR family transcriptional regulator